MKGQQLVAPADRVLATVMAVILVIWGEVVVASMAWLHVTVTPSLVLIDWLLSSLQLLLGLGGLVCLTQGVVLAARLVDRPASFVKPG